MVDVADVQFGRLPAHGVGEDKDDQHPLRAALLVAPALPRYKYWTNRAGPLDQGATGTCVAHGCKTWMLTYPVVQVKASGPPTPFDLYRQIVLVDEWRENDREATLPDDQLQYGTSVRAGFKLLQQKGYVAEYLWAQVLEDVVDFVSLKGPVVIGVEWTADMMRPDSRGLIHPTGSVLGGHCVTIIGVSNTDRHFTILNSWGRGWGIDGTGRARISFADLEDLLFARGGEAAAGLEIKVTA